ncbi:MAG: STAS domain-containing protein [Planctomycetota bacterium]
MSADSRQKTKPDGDQIEVAIVGKTVYLKPHGLASQENSLGIPDFLEAMFRAGCRDVVFDLEDCRGMDSTFLGVIADAATSLPRVPGKTVVVLNANERACRQLRRIGLTPLICMHAGEVEVPSELKFRKIDFVHLPKNESERLQKIKKLHQQLASLNEKNKKTFAPFIEMLEEELEQEQAEEQQ